MHFLYFCISIFLLTLSAENFVHLSQSKGNQDFQCWLRTLTMFTDNLLHPKVYSFIGLIFFLSSFISAPTGFSSSFPHSSVIGFFLILSLLFLLSSLSPPFPIYLPFRKMQELCKTDFKTNENIQVQSNLVLSSDVLMFSDVEIACSDLRLSEILITKFCLCEEYSSWV